MMPQTQIAFDFGDLPEQPLAEDKPAGGKKNVRKKKMPDPVVEINLVKAKSTRGRKSMKEMSAGVELIRNPRRCHPVPKDVLFNWKSGRNV